MAIINRFACWMLETACFVGYVFAIVTAIFALILRLVDITAIFDPNFEISRGFESHWRTHAWNGFIATDVVMSFYHGVIIIFSIFMAYLVDNKHFIITLSWKRGYLGVFICYILCELAIALFEFSFYNINTFRLPFVVFLWIFWMFRTVANVCIAVVIYARISEINELMEKELRFAGEKKHGYL